MLRRIFGLVILGGAVLGIDALALSEDARLTDAEAKAIATRIAEEQQKHVDALPHDALLLTAGFEPVAWIATPGLEPGEVERGAMRDGERLEGALQLYTVKWNVEDADPSGTLKRVEVLVEWQGRDDETRRVRVTSLRAGMDAG